jgi:quercetin dioxygenase-like cupin family protein
MTDAYNVPSVWNDKPDAWHEIMPGVRRRILNHASTGMMVHYKIEPGKTFPRHNHPHAQFGVILEGQGVFKIDGKVWTVKPGDGYFIPPGIFHEFSIEGSVPAIAIDFFTPERDDYLGETLEPDKN